MKKRIQFQVMTIMKMISQISTHKHNSTMTIMKMIGQISTHKHNSMLLLLEQWFWTEKEMNYETSIQRKKYHNFRYACEEKTSRCFFTNKTTGTKINNTTSKASCKWITKTRSIEQKYHNFRYVCEEKTCRCFTNKTTGTKISISTRQHYYSLATSNRL